MNFRQRIFACSTVTMLIGCAEPGEHCTTSQEIDVRVANLPVGTWLCHDYYEVRIDEEGKPRQIESQFFDPMCFSCNVDDHFPLVLGDRNVRAGNHFDIGGKARVGYSRELVDVELESGYLLLTYEVGFTDAAKSVLQYAFRVEGNGDLGYAGSSIVNFPLQWHLCKRVDASKFSERIGPT